MVHILSPDDALEQKTNAFRMQAVDKNRADRSSHDINVSGFSRKDRSLEDICLSLA